MDEKKNHTSLLVYNRLSKLENTLLWTWLTQTTIETQKSPLNRPGTKLVENVQQFTAKFVFINVPQDQVTADNWAGPSTVAV